MAQTNTMLKKVRTIPSIRGIAALAIGRGADAAAQTERLRGLWWAAILLLGLSAGAVGWTIWQLRNDSIRAAIADSGNIAAVLAGQLSRSLQAIDNVLLDVVRSSKDLDVETPADFATAFDHKTIYDLLTGYRSPLPQIFNIAIA